jgi:RNA polymerase sigma factor (TIGR02999 family)
MKDVTALLEPALSGDRNAQDELFRHVEPELRQLAWHWLRRKAAQERIQVSELLDRVFTKLMKIESPCWQHRGQFYWYACRNMPCVLIDLLRAQDRHRRLFQNEDQHAIIDAAAAQQRGLSETSVISLADAIASLENELSPDHRKIVELKYFGELTLDAISESTSIERTKVHRMLKVAMECLRTRLATSFPEFDSTDADGEDAR